MSTAWPKDLACFPALHVSNCSSWAVGTDATNLFPAVMACGQKWFSEPWLALALENGNCSFQLITGEQRDNGKQSRREEVASGRR